MSQNYINSHRSARSKGEGMKKHKATKTTEETKVPESEEISLDFSAMNKFFSSWRRVNMDIVVMCVFILFSIILITSIRMLPAALPITDDWAASALHENIKGQVAQEIDAQFPALPTENRNALIERRTNEIISQNQAQYDQTQEQVSQQFKSYLRYTGEDGKEYTYLGDLDSYFWLRYTRNIMRNGHTCDVVTAEGQCRDMYVLAPVGQPSTFNPAAHVFAIYVVYQVLSVFNPHIPLVQAGHWTHLLLGILCVIPAFFVGRKLAGNVGGLFTAIIVSLHPMHLSRTLGNDNDTWQILIPLLVVWFIFEALDARTDKSRITFSILAAVSIGLLAAAWEGWWFFYLIVLFGLVGYVIFRIITAITHHIGNWWKEERVRATAIVFIVFYIATFFALILPGKAGEYFTTPRYVVSASAGLDRAIVNDYWPNVFTTVAELNKSSFGEAVNAMGGKFFFLCGLIGLLLLVLPHHNWKWKHWALLGAGTLISIYLVNTTGLGKFTVLALIALPLAIIILFYLFDNEDTQIGTALIVLVWFLASVYATYSGVRFIVLMIPAFGIAFGVFAGRIYETLSNYIAKEVNIHRYIINTIVFLLIALLLIQPIKAGQSTARNYIPSIDDAWWDTLTKINKESKPDAIINSWWDFGHWFKYVADRRVSADGTSQGTHVPRWLGLALVTPNERTSIGVLRMLDCGSDAGSGPEAESSAYTKINKRVNDSITAQNMVVTLINLDKEPARRYLAAHGFTEAEQVSILNSTHCAPPEDYFITSGDMVGKAGVWAHFGLWNFENAYIAQHSRYLPMQDAVDDLVKKFNYTPAHAQDLYYQAKGLTSEGEVNQFAAPWPGYITSNWVACSSLANNSAMLCPLGIGIGQQGSTFTSIDTFMFNFTNPASSALSYGFYQNGQRIGAVTNGTPQQIVLAYNDRMDELNFTQPTSPGIAVLVDMPNKRILIVDPLLAKSTFTQLFFLDGRYSTYFTKFDDRTSFSGSRVITWKVNWNGNAGQSGTSTTAFITG
jgi:dolichyl-phosphooligosaccharide-protein glycotransferase